MKNFIQPGDVVTLTAPYAVVSGAGAKVGSIFGVATGDVGNGLEGEFRLTGVFDLAKVTTDVIAAGAKLYWDDSAKLVTTAAAAGVNLLIGVALLAAGNPSALARVRLTAAFTI